MVVYCVFAGQYEDRELRGIFSTLEQAQLHASAFNETLEDGEEDMDCAHRPEKWEIDRWDGEIWEPPT